MDQAKGNIYKLIILNCICYCYYVFFLCNLNLRPHEIKYIWYRYRKWPYRVFSHDVTAAILVSQNNETVATVGVPN